MSFKENNNSADEYSEGESANESEIGSIPDYDEEDEDMDNSVDGDLAEGDPKENVSDDESVGSEQSGVDDDLRGVNKETLKKDEALLFDELDRSDDSDSDASDDSDLSDDDIYYEKINNIHHDQLNKYHNDKKILLMKDIEALSDTVKDTAGNVLRKKTIPFLTKYEFTRIIGIRKTQLDNGAPSYLEDIPTNIVDNKLIAKAEILGKKLPWLIKRTYGKNHEFIKLKDLEIINIDDVTTFDLWNKTK